jgi:hypothetical protein
MSKIIQDMIPSKNKPPLREAIPMERRSSRRVEEIDDSEMEKPPVKTPRRKATFSHEQPLARTNEHPAERVRENIVHEKIHVVESMPEDLPNETIIPRTPKNQPRRAQRGIVGQRTVKPWLFGVIALLCVCAFAFAFSIVYARATVTITPTSIIIPISGSFTAYDNAVASGTLAYKIIQANGQLSQTVAATVGPIVTTSAKGTVILYNDYTASTQRIIAGTRLESGNGLIYTTNAAVTIPGISGGTAGSVPVAVTAGAGGPTYNILPSDLLNNPSYGDFTVVAYKGTARASGFYARLNPNGAGITGGASGHQIIAGSSTVAAANQTMEQSLQTSLLSQAQALIPSGYIMFNNGYSISYNPIAASTTSSTTASVGMQASISGIIFQKTDLAEAIAPSQYSSSFIPEGLDTAVFTITNPQTFTTANGTVLNFSLTGNLDLVGTLSTSTLANQLAGISLAQSAAVFKGYGAIATAHATILPFWKRSFPSSPSRINIVIANN